MVFDGTVQFMGSKLGPLEKDSVQQLHISQKTDNLIHKLHLLHHRRGGERGHNIKTMNMKEMKDNCNVKTYSF
jgi:hypothetical protein